MRKRAWWFVWADAHARMCVLVSWYKLHKWCLGFLCLRVTPRFNMIYLNPTAGQSHRSCESPQFAPVYFRFSWRSTKLKNQSTRSKFSPRHTSWGGMKWSTSCRKEMCCFKISSIPFSWAFTIPSKRLTSCILSWITWMVERYFFQLRFQSINTHFLCVALCFGQQDSEQLTQGSCFWCCSCSFTSKESGASQNRGLAFTAQRSPVRWGTFILWTSFTGEMNALQTGVFFSLALLIKNELCVVWSIYFCGFCLVWLLCCFEHYGKWTRTQSLWKHKAWVLWKFYTIHNASKPDIPQLC